MFKSNQTLFAIVVNVIVKHLYLQKKFGFLVPVNTTSYLPNINKDRCVGCGKCTKVCPMEAIKLKETSLENHNSKIAELSEDLCLGCGFV